MRPSRPLNRSPFQFQDIIVSLTPPIDSPVIGLSINADEALRLLSAPQTRDTKLPRPSADFLLIRDQQPSDKGSVDVQAQLVASFAAGRLDGIGIVPEIDVFRGDPYLVARAIASLDIVSRGRAGFLPIATRGSEQDIGYAKTGSDAAYVAEFIKAVGSLWNNWQPGALARDWTNNRYIDRDRIAEANHEGAYFSVKGPLPTPTAIQAAPPVIARNASAHAGIASKALAVIHDTPADTEKDKGPALVEIALDSARLPEGLAADAGIVLHTDGGFADWAELVEHTQQALARLGLEWKPSYATLTDILAPRPATSLSEISHV